MRRKLTIDFIRSEFEKEGHQLLTTEYINKQKLNYICPDGHKHSISWNNWWKGQRCPYCAGNAKYSINFIRSEFAKEGYKLLTTEYKNSKQTLYYVCPNGHYSSTRWNSWQQGYRCFDCYCDVIKPTIDFIKSEFAKEGYQLLTTKYKNNRQKLNYICPNGHQHSITWHHWHISKNRCPHCAGVVSPTIEFIKKQFEKEDCTLLDTEYKNAFQKLDYICSNGHHHSITWSDWQQGHRCGICADINNSGSGNPNWKGGISSEPYCPIWSDKEYKSDIKLRDGNQCLNPYCLGIGNKLHIHHIDYDKKNCAPQNLITVCNSCNFRANTDREWHTEWYRTILNKRYGYKY